MECQRAHWTTKLSKTTWWKPVKLLAVAELCAAVVPRMWRAERSRTLCGQAAAVARLLFLLHVFVCVPLFYVSGNKPVNWRRARSPPWK